MSNLFCGSGGLVDHTWPMLFVTAHVGVQTYASRNPSSLCVTIILVAEARGDHAIRTPSIGLPAVDCSASAPHEDPSHVLVFGHHRREVAHAPVFERYAIPASAESVLSR